MKNLLRSSQPLLLPLPPVTECTLGCSVLLKDGFIKGDGSVSRPTDLRQHTHATALAALTRFGLGRLQNIDFCDAMDFFLFPCAVMNGVWWTATSLRLHRQPVLVKPQNTLLFHIQPHQAATQLYPPTLQPNTLLLLSLTLPTPHMHPARAHTDQVEAFGSQGAVSRVCVVCGDQQKFHNK